MERNPQHLSEEEVFTQAVQLPESARIPYLEREYGDNPALRQRVEVLLNAHAEAGNFMEQPSAGSGDPNWLPGGTWEKPGDWIGRYKLLQQIGEGGCGVVYLSEQVEPVRRRVALKIIKPGMDTRSVIARFEAERQALALMDHPHIAKVFDAGATASGRPYFVMEWVRGIKITTYCDEHALPTLDRLKLFIQVCQAVQHAHQKGIVHRDLKPSNILVTTTENGAPSPVVIDFGIAKATTDQRLTDKTLFTAFEMLIGTPAYMSPEQATLTSIDVDTRTDIYSLGVLLYELLTGATPFDTGELLKAGLDEVRRVIREQEPVRPSTRLRRLNDSDLTSIAQRRHAAPPALIRAVRGDLDWIVLKALDKNRVRRYGTASGLALDIEHYLANETVSARPDSAAYRFRKALLRNKLLFGSVAFVTVVLLISFVVVSVALVRDRQARRETEAALQQARAGVEVVARQAFQLRQRILMIGNSPSSPGSSPKADVTHADAEAGFRETLSIQRQILGVEHPAYIDTLENLGRILYAESHLGEAETVLRKALELRLRISSAENLEVAVTRYDLSRVLNHQHKNAQAESEGRQSLAIMGRLLSNHDPRIAKVLAEVVYALQVQKKFTEAEQLLQEHVNPEVLSQPQGGEFQIVRIEYHARQQQWAAAAAAGEQAVQLHPLDHRLYHLLAPLLVEARELVRYQELCQKILTTFGGVTDPFIADRMAKDCLLLPSAGVNLSLVNQLAETAVYEGRGAVALPNFHACKALAEYRLGNSDRAVEWANKARDTNYPDARTMAYSVLAMAHAQLDEMKEARAALAAAEIAVAQLPRRGTDNLGENWQGWAFAQQLIEQARALVVVGDPVAPEGERRPEVAESNTPFAAGQPSISLQ